MDCYAQSQLDWNRVWVSVFQYITPKAWWTILSSIPSQSYDKNVHTFPDHMWQCPYNTRKQAPWVYDIRQHSKAFVRRLGLNNLRHSDIIGYFTMLDGLWRSSVSASDTVLINTVFKRNRWKLAGSRAQYWLRIEICRDVGAFFFVQLWINFAEKRAERAMHGSVASTLEVGARFSL